MKHLADSRITAPIEPAYVSRWKDPSTFIFTCLGFGLSYFWHCLSCISSNRHTNILHWDKGGTDSLWVRCHRIHHSYQEATAMVSFGLILSKPCNILSCSRMSCSSWTRPINHNSLINSCTQTKRCPQLPSYIELEKKVHDIFGSNATYWTLSASPHITIGKNGFERQDSVQRPR
jgi:hypothetical protein